MQYSTDVPFQSYPAPLSNNTIPAKGIFGVTRKTRIGGTGSAVPSAKSARSKNDVFCVVSRTIANLAQDVPVSVIR